MDHLDHPGDGLYAFDHLDVVVVDHPGNEGYVVQQVIDGHHHLYSIRGRNIIIVFIIFQMEHKQENGIATYLLVGKKVLVPPGYICFELFQGSPTH